MLQNTSALVKQPSKFESFAWHLLLWSFNEPWGRMQFSSKWLLEYLEEFWVPDGVRSFSSKDMSLLRVSHQGGMPNVRTLEHITMPYGESCLNSANFTRNFLEVFPGWKYAVVHSTAVKYSSMMRTYEDNMSIKLWVFARMSYRSGDAGDPITAIADTNSYRMEGVLMLTLWLRLLAIPLVEVMKLQMTMLAWPRRFKGYWIHHIQWLMNCW